MRSVDETRRSFLLRMARGAAFVVPTMTTLGVRPQGKGGGGKGDPPGPPPGISPPAGGFLRQRSEQGTAPWKAGSPSSRDAPWSSGPGGADGGDSGWPPDGGGRKDPPGG